MRWPRAVWVRQSAWVWSNSIAAASQVDVRVPGHGAVAEGPEVRVRRVTELELVGAQPVLPGVLEWIARAQESGPEGSLPELEAAVGNRSIVERGGNFIDTANAYGYGAAERAVGHGGCDRRAFADLRG